MLCQNYSRGVFGDIAGYRSLLEELKASEAQLRLILENTHDTIVRLNTEGIIEYISPSCRRITGRSPGQIIGKSYFNFVHPDDLESTAYKTLLQTHAHTHYELRYRHEAGHYIWIEVAGNVLLNERGRVTGTIMAVREITGRKQAEEKLREAHRQLIDIIDFLPDPTMVVNKEKIIIAWNKAMEECTGVKKEEVLGKDDSRPAEKIYGAPRPLLIDFTFDDKELASYVPKYSNIKRKGNVLHAEAFVPSLFNGKGAYVWITAAPLYDRKGNQVGAIETVRDMTERRQMEGKLKFLSLHDALTGLYNRAYFDEEMHRLRGGRQLPLGIIVCDVDGLKLINDTMGHKGGNALLVAAANLLKSCFRSGDLIARIGGDEFAVLLPGTDKEAVENACRRLRQAIDRYNTVNAALPLSLSLGFAVGNDPGKDPCELFMEADLHMHREKLSHSQSTRSTIVKVLQKMLEARDFATEGHAARMQHLVARLAIACGIPEYRLNDLRLLALFHDLGKIGIPDQILFKSGPLTNEEHHEIKKHCEIGYNIANSVPDLIPVAEWILKHHEWFNGGGYPLGLRGEEIPLECRILAVVDAYDAMTSDRPYRKAMRQEDALAELERCSGSQFDPQIIANLIKMLKNCIHCTETTFTY